MVTTNTHLAIAPALDVTQAWISQSLEHQRPLTCCRFSPNGKFLFASGQDDDVLRWDLETGTKTTLAGHRSWVDSMALLADSSRLFTADFQGVICCWESEAQQPTPLWINADAHRGWIRALAAVPGGKLLSAGNDRVIRLWSAADGKPLGEFNGHENYVFSLAVAPDGKSFVSGDLFGKCRVHRGSPWCRLVLISS